MMKKKSLIEINKIAIQVIKKIRLLENISWPKNIEQEIYINLWNNKRKRVEFCFPKKNVREEITTLKNLLPYLSSENPLHHYSLLNIKSYINALKMIESVGTPRFQELSIEEYGHPRHLLFGSQYSHLKTAEQFLKSFKDFDHPYVKDSQKVFSAKKFKEFLTSESHKTLKEHSPKFSLSKKLIAKAAAGKNRVRIRQDAKFNEVEFKNLLIHEVFTHSLTAINGSLQKELPLLQYGAPRTTKTQEGLATFSEVITGLLDLDRLKRISLRVSAIDLALNGANIYELYDFFRENGQNEKESFHSSCRILRGGKPEGGIVFTKDGVYLEGLIRVHSFFRWAFKTNNLELIHLLLVGRLDINDVFLLQDSYQQGLIKHPTYLPSWYENDKLLAGKMAFSLILNDICLQNVEEYFTAKFLDLNAA